MWNVSELTIVIISEQIHLTLGWATAVRSANTVTRQLVIITPEQTGKGNVDERCGQSLLEHIHPDCLLDAFIVSDLPHAGQVGHIRDGDEGRLGVSLTLGLIEEVEFPGNIRVINVSAKKP